PNHTFSPYRTLFRSDRDALQRHARGSDGDGGAAADIAVARQPCRERFTARGVCGIVIAQRPVDLDRAEADERQTSDVDGDVLVVDRKSTRLNSSHVK